MKTTYSKFVANPKASNHSTEDYIIANRLQLFYMNKEQVEQIATQIQAYLEQITKQKYSINIEKTILGNWYYVYISIYDNTIVAQRWYDEGANPNWISYYDLLKGSSLSVFLFRKPPEPTQPIEDYLEQNFYHRPIKYLG
jgi:hypothetical protein